MKKPPLTKRDNDAIVYLITKKYKSVTDTAKLFNRSRQAIYNVLKKHKVKIRDYAWVDVNCNYCGRGFKKRRCLVRYTNRDFCNFKCMGGYIKKHGMEGWVGKGEENDI